MSISIVLVVITFAFVAYGYLGYRKMKNAPVVPNHASLVELTDENFNLQTGNKIALVDFWATWCMPCKVMAPIINDVAAQTDSHVLVGKVDIDANPKVAAKMNIRNIPTVVFFNNGVEVKRFVGVKSKDFYINELKKMS